MTVGGVTLPAQGTGATEPDVAVDKIAGREYQLLKLVDGTVDGTNPVPASLPLDVADGKVGLWVNNQLMLYDHAAGKWSRARGSVANGLLVDVSRVQGAVGVAGAVSVTSLPTAPANNGVDIGDVTVNNTVGQAIPVNVVATVDGGGGGGGATALAAVAHTVAAVTTSSSTVLSANAARRYLLLENISDVNMYLRIGGTAVAGQGIQINAGGGAYEMSLPYGNLSLVAIHAIHASTGSKTLLVTEGT